MRVPQLHTNDKEFAYTPIGTFQPNGQQVQWELINIFRYTDGGRLIEEWVQTDTYDFLRQARRGRELTMAGYEPVYLRIELS